MAEQSALAVVTFVADRHKYSAEQLCNVLVAEGFLCFCDEENKVHTLLRTHTTFTSVFVDVDAG